MERIIASLREELTSFIQRRGFDRDVAAALSPPDIWDDALRVLMFLDCVDEEARGFRDARVLVLAEEPVQGQVFAEWLILSGLLPRWIGRARSGWNGVTHSDAGPIRIGLRSGFRENWVWPSANIPARPGAGSPDGGAAVTLPGAWECALFKAVGGRIWP